MDILTFPDYFHEAEGKEFMISMLTFPKKKWKTIKNFRKLKKILKIFKFL